MQTTRCPALTLALGWFAVIAAAPAPAAAVEILGHLAPLTGPGKCSRPPAAVGCDGGQYAAVIEGDLNVEYDFYVLAAGIDPVDGLSSVEVGIHYYGADPGVGIDINGWQTCATTEFPVGWPAPNSTNTFFFASCSPHVADPLDPGREFAVLGAARISAASIDQLRFLDPVFQDCASGLLFPSGEASAVGFGFYGENPCDGTVVDGFPATCCLPGGCLTVPYLDCYYQGGTWLGFEPCSSCSVPAENTTWSRIKSLNR